MVSEGGSKVRVTARADLPTAQHYAWIVDGFRSSTTAALDVTLPIGRHVISLRVTDIGGTATASATAIVSFQPSKPTAALRLRAGGQEITEGVLELLSVGAPISVSFSAVGSFDGLGRVLRYTWKLNDIEVSSEREFVRDLAIGEYRVSLR